MTTVDLVTIWDGCRNGPGGALLLPDRAEHPSVLVQASERFSVGTLQSLRGARVAQQKAIERAHPTDSRIWHCACGCGQVLPPYVARSGRRRPVFLSGHKRLGGLVWAARAGSCG